ncbi:MAG TPA: hemolysin family protein [Alphaproteobacteria bacterium]|jgi:magnesium and cobalt transporter|nr:hemolysin family protein [Alphaproteobacteria bacterium]
MSDSSDSHTSERKTGLRRLLSRLVPKPKPEDELRDAIAEIIEERDEENGAETGITADERLLITNVLKLRDLTVQDIMVPRAEIVAVDASMKIADLLAVMTREAHSRMPVIRGTLDDVMGFVHIKDVLVHMNAGPDFDLSRIVRRALIISPAMRVLDLLLEMRFTRTHLALVVDEYGGIDGLVSIEDVVEEIVGDIQDEHDVEDPVMIARPDGTMLADARARLEDFEAQVGPILTEDERDGDQTTLGGLLTAIAGRVPARGEVIRHSSGVEFEVIDADPRRVRRLRIRNLPKKPADDD